MNGIRAGNNAKQKTYNTHRVVILHDLYGFVDVSLAQDAYEKLYSTAHPDDVNFQLFDLWEEDHWPQEYNYTYVHDRGFVRMVRDGGPRRRSAGDTKRQRVARSPANLHYGGREGDVSELRGCASVVPQHR